MVSQKSTDQKYSVDHQDEMTSPNGGTVILAGGTTTLGGGTVTSGGGSQTQVAERRSTPFWLNLTTAFSAKK